LTTALELAAVASPSRADVARDDALWRRIEALVERAPSESDLRSHGLELLAAHHRLRGGRPLSDSALAARRTAAATSLLAPLVLERTLAAVQAPVVLMKGPEVALSYEDPLTRSFRDLDLLVGDAEAAWAAMLAAGFQQTGDPALYVGIHHLRPLVWPGLPLAVEIHSRPKWIEQLAPPVGELLETAVPSSTGIPGLLTLEPARHAVVLAVHAWAHVPLGRLDRLIDVAAMSQGVDRGTLEDVARAWGVRPLWRTTQAVVDSLFGRRPRPAAGQVWSRHLWSVRERAVVERHLERWLAPFWALPPAQAVRATRRHIAGTLEVQPGESRRQTVARWRRAMAGAFTPLSEHNSTGEPVSGAGEEKQ
jgi:hypothetical protein